MISGIVSSRQIARARPGRGKKGEVCLLHCEGTGQGGISTRMPECVSKELLREAMARVSESLLPGSTSELVTLQDAGRGSHPALGQADQDRLHGLRSKPAPISPVQMFERLGDTNCRTQNRVLLVSPCGISSMPL